MNKPTQRRLAAIVSADVVGYSRLMGVDEVGTLAALRAHRPELIDAKIAEHGGRIVKTMGDGLLLEFPSVVDATTCAIEVQEGMAARNAEAPDDKRIIFRIGVNLGDIIIEGEDILGDSVNIAARIEALAEPGGVAISGRVHDDVRDRLDTAFADTGEHSLKNIARSVRVWQWSAKGRQTTSNAPAMDEKLALPDKPSIAVLPFNNMSGDPEQEFLADGLAEDITTALSRHRWLFVIARNSAFTYKGLAVDVAQIGRELGVRYVLEGSVRKSGDRIRATAQLIDTETHSQIWAERYDRVLVDVFDLQDEITANIVGTIEPNLMAAERDRFDRGQTTNLNAWECIVRATPNIWSLDVGKFQGANALLQQALALDPNHARPHGLLACSYAVASWQNWAGAPADADTLTEYHARRSIELDVSDPWAHLALGLANGVRRDNDTSMWSLNTAISLNPNFALAFTVRGIVHAWGGRPNEALSDMDLADRLSPHDPFQTGLSSMRATALFVARQFEEAVEAARENVNSHQNASGFYRILSASCAMAGKQVEAREAMARLRILQPNISATWMREKFPMSDQTALELYVEGLLKAGMPE